jgi:uncharacterized phage protein gp47/JayE
MLPLIAVFAGAIYLCYGFLERLSKQFFFTTADTEHVGWHARMYGIPRLDAEESVGTVRFTGVNTTLVPEETEVQTEDGIIFETDADGTISGGIADIDITAQVAGTSGNVDVTTMTLVTPITDIDSTVTIVTELSGGVDQETIDAAVVRLLQRTQNPPGSGNIGDYERWALSVAGVGRVWPKSGSDWQGAGTVGVIIATSDLEVVGTAIKTNVETYIESKRPVGADVTIADPAIKEVKFDISITPFTSELETAIDTKLSEIFFLESEPGGTMKISHIRTAIHEAGVSDYEITDILVDDVSVGVGDITSITLELLRYNSSTYVELT